MHKPPYEWKDEYDLFKPKYFWCVAPSDSILSCLLGRSLLPQSMLVWGHCIRISR